MEIISKKLAAGLLKTSDVNIPQNDLSKDKIPQLLSVVFGIMGGIAVIIIILAGIKFVMSQGDPGATAKARNTIIYAAVGLAVSIAAFSIVVFVVGKV